MKEMKKCVFAGTFDPPTLGHKALIEECLKLFDEVVVAIMINPAKLPCFTLDQREEMLNLMFKNEPRIRISIDLDYENANFYASKKLDPTITAIYLPCPQELLHVSSSIVRNSLKFKTPIEEYVSKEVREYIEALSHHLVDF